MIEITPAKHIAAAMDSVRLINALVASGKTDKDSLDSLERNYMHLELICAKDYAKDFTTEVAQMTEAISSAKAVHAN